MREKYSWLGRRFVGDLYTLSLYIYGYVQMPSGSRTNFNPAWMIWPNDLNSSISLWPPATMAFSEEVPHQSSCFAHHSVPRTVPSTSHHTVEIWWMNEWTELQEPTEKFQKWEFEAFGCDWFSQVICRLLS